MIKPFRVKDRYNGQWLIKFKAPDGKYRMIVGGGTKKEAEKTLRSILTDIERGTWDDPREQRKEAACQRASTTTWGDLLERFKKSKYTKPEQKNSLSCLEYTIKFLDEGREGSGTLLSQDTPLSKITKKKMRAIYDAMLSFNLAVRTKNLRLTYMRIVFRWAVKHPAVPMDRDPSEGLERFKETGSRSRNVLARTVEPDEVFSLDEVNKIITYAREKMSAANAAMIETAFATGLRRGELVGLKWVDVDFKNGIICVRRNYD